MNEASAARGHVSAAACGRVLVRIGLFAVISRSFTSRCWPVLSSAEQAGRPGRWRIAAASGLGAGILAARLTELRPNFALMLPKLLLASLVLTPVFYPLSALGGLKDTWCLANPLCVATELGRAGISFQADALPRYAISIACASSGAILCWGLLTLRLRPISFADEHV